MNFLLILFALWPLWLKGETVTPPEEPKAENPTVIFKKTESHKFGDLKLKGQLKKPDLSYIYKRKGLRAEEIVDIPENFNEELNQGAGQF